MVCSQERLRLRCLISFDNTDAVFLDLHRNHPTVRRCKEKLDKSDKENLMRFLNDGADEL
jgi:hypothetical protein